MAWLKEHLFSSKLNTVITLVLLYCVFLTVPALLDWLIFSSVINSDATTCREASGACWSFIQEKWRFIVFGRYPHELQWRPGLAMLIFFGLLWYSVDRKHWQAKLGLAWILSFPLFIWLIKGGLIFEPVDIELLGGLPLTLLLSTVGIVCAYPLGILLALARRSSLPMLRTLSITYIELIRGVPLVTLLFMASIMLPLFLPQGMTIDKLLRAQVALILFTAAYLAEVVRGGLQALPKGQYEAAHALGLSTAQMYLKVILPQALKIVIPPTVGNFISLFKDTSLVLIIGLLDLMLAAKTASIDANWQGFSTESYLFAAFIYFICCFSMAKYSRRLEREHKVRT